MKRYLAFFFVAAACAACAQVGYRNEAGIFNADLRDAYVHFDRTMVAPRPALAFASGRTVKDCADYLAQGRSMPIGEGVNNRIVAQEYLVCDSVALLRQAGGSGGTAYRPASYGEELQRRLDLRGFPSSLRPLTDDRRFTLADVAVGAARVEPHGVTVETDEWRYRVEVVADVATADGGQDWLLWFSDVAKKGNYRAYEVLVVHSPSAVGLLSAQALH